MLLHVYACRCFSQYITWHESILTLPLAIHDEPVFEVSLLGQALLLNTCNWQLEVPLRLPLVVLLRRLSHPSYFGESLSIQI